MRWLDRSDTAAVSGVAKRPTDVVTQTKRRHAACKCGTLAATGAARRAIGLPWVFGTAIQAGVGVNAQTQVGQVGAANNNCACSLDALYCRRVCRRDCLGQRRNTLRGGITRNVDVFFHGHRHAVQRPKFFTGAHRGVSQVGPRKCLIGKHTNDRIYFGVHFRNSLKMSLYHLAACHLFVANVGCYLSSGVLPNFVCHVRPLSLTA